MAPIKFEPSCGSKGSEFQCKIRKVKYRTRIESSVARIIHLVTNIGFVWKVVGSFGSNSRPHSGQRCTPPEVSFRRSYLQERQRIAGAITSAPLSRSR